MKTIQTCVLLILLFTASICSQDVNSSEIDAEPIAAKSSQTEDPQALGTNLGDKVPDGVDNIKNEDEIATAIPKEDESAAVVESDPSAETPIETPETDAKETESPSEGNTGTTEIETSKTEQPETGTVVEDTKNTGSAVPNNISATSETETSATDILSEANSGTSETETSKIEKTETEAVVQDAVKPGTSEIETLTTEETETEARVEDSKKTESPIANNESVTEAEIPSEVKPDTSETETSATEIPSEVNTGTQETETSKTEQTETESVVEDAKTTESLTTNNESVTETEIPSEVNTGTSETGTSNTEQTVTEDANNTLPTSTEVNQVTAESTHDPNEASSTTMTPCTEVGNFAKPTNCRQYLSCSYNATNLISEDCKCPERTAFNPVLGRCTRDLSPCLDEEPVCIRASSISNPNGETTSYFWCVPSLLGGFHKYQIQCSENEIFMPLIGICWIQTPLPGLGFGLINREPNDRDIVRAEWKLLRKEIKLKLKAEKLQKKMEEKAKARAEKLAAKELLKIQKEVARKVDDEDEEDEGDD